MAHRRDPLRGVGTRRDIDPERLVRAIKAGDRAALARAITLIESSRPEDRRLARQLQVHLFVPGRRAVRVGVTGPPGAGKSTLIEALGLLLVEQGHRLAVLAIDPTSRLTGGSVLGDKTRMEQLARHSRAFIRPSPSGDTLGGVARRTRETVLLCEAAGYDTVLVETVGVGQAETLVSQLVDTVLLVIIAGAGDELQGIKRGIMETADVVAVNKADGRGRSRAEEAASGYSSALRILPGRGSGWRTPVTTVSALDGLHLDRLLEQLQAHRAHLISEGSLENHRAEQAVFWLDFLLTDGLRERLTARPEIRALLERLRQQVRDGSMSADDAAARLLDSAGLL